MPQTAFSSPEKIIIAAVADNGVIGRNGALPWDLPADRRLFRRHTLGHTLIMGRRTFLSLARPLDGRLNLVVATRLAPQPGIEIYASFAAALARAEQVGRRIFFIGGAGIYRQALNVADRMFLCRIPGDFTGDTYFPSFSAEDWRLVRHEPQDGFELHTYLRR